MSQKFRALISGIVLLAATIFPLSLASAQAVSLQEQLKAQYKLVKTGTDANGLTVVEPGTVLDVRKGGLLGVSPQSAIFCPSKFQDGNLKSPNGFCAAMVKQNSRYLQVGEKVYPTRIDVNLDKDKVAFQVMECDSCNGVQEPSFYKSEVVFQFAKGALAKTSAGEVEDVIGQLLSIGTDDAQQGQAGQQQGGDQGGNGQQGGNDQEGNNQGGGGGQAQQAPPPEPQQIEKGQTPDQVKAAFGTPDKIINLGPKQIFVYKDLKVTFLNGKVSDVQ